MMNFRKSLALRSGFTLVELAGVLIILVLLAAMVIPLVGGAGGSVSIDIGNGDQSAESIVTQTTMQTIRDTIVSTETTTGLWADMGHLSNRLPRTIGQIFSEDPPLAGTPVFDPITRIGWRGPYLSQATGIYPDVTTDDWGLRNFTSSYGAPGDDTMIDAWGNPIVLQIDFDSDNNITSNEAQAARLVSAGPNGTIDWALDVNLGQADYQSDYQNQLTDDVVVYLGIMQ